MASTSMIYIDTFGGHKPSGEDHGIYAVSDPCFALSTGSYDFCMEQLASMIAGTDEFFCDGTVTYVAWDEL